MRRRWYIVLAAGCLFGVATDAFAGGAAGPGVGASHAWCASVTGPDGGYVSCSYATGQECMTTLSGLGGICHPNPAPVRGDAPAQSKPHGRLRNG
jgi:hypothetical protein